jgi:hypothetical protein
MIKISRWDLVLLLFLALLVRLPFLLQSGNLIDFDEATFGLMAKRILEGEIPLYISGHSYSGSLVSFVMTPFIFLFGTQPIAIKLAPLLFFLSFFTINYFLLERIFSRPVSLFANLFFVCLPAGIFDLSSRAWGGHVELWPFASGLLLLLCLYFDSKIPEPKKNLILGGAGFASGIALWLNPLFFLFLIPYLFYFLLHRRQFPQSFGAFLNEAFWVKEGRVPLWLRVLLIGVHGFIVFFLLVQLVSLFPARLQGNALEPLIRMFGTDPPFRIKELMKIALFLLGEGIFLYLFAPSGPQERRSRLERLGFAGSGFVLGNLPALAFNLLGGEGLRIFHKSGFIFFQLLSSRFHDIFLHKIPNFVLGLGTIPPSPSASFTIADRIWFFFLASLVLATAVLYRKGPSPVSRFPEESRPSYLAIFFLIGVFTLLANLVTTLEAERYLAPLYLALAVILGVFLGDFLWKRSRVLSCLLGVLIAGHFLYTGYLYYRTIPKQRSETYHEILDYLESRNVRGGFSSRSLSHILTFLAGEKMVFSTFLQPERYLPHEEYAQALRRPAYVFEKDGEADLQFQEKRALVRKVTESKTFGGYVVYLTERSELSGRAGNLPDGGWPARPGFRLRLYLNEMPLKAEKMVR